MLCSNAAWVAVRRLPPRIPSKPLQFAQPHLEFIGAPYLIYHRCNKFTYPHINILLLAAKFIPWVSVSCMNEQFSYGLAVNLLSVLTDPFFLMQSFSHTCPYINLYVSPFFHDKKQLYSEPMFGACVSFVAVVLHII